MTDPDGFWREAVSLINWETEPETSMNASGLWRRTSMGPRCRWPSGWR